MIVDLVELAGILKTLDMLNAIDPQLLRYSDRDKLLVNESSLSNSDYARKLIDLFTQPPERPYPS